MSAHVVVIDATAKRATIKTTPGKHLTDILQEACSKLGYNSSQYGLKYVFIDPAKMQ
jgi:tether containing UBX domain for GLUT4